MIESFDDIEKLKEFAKTLAYEKENGIKRWGSDRYFEYVIKINSKIIELDPNEIYAYTRLAKAYYEAGKISHALYIYQQILKENRDESITKIAKKFIARHENLLDDFKLLHAVKSYEEAITIAISVRRTRGSSKFAVEILRKAYKYSESISQKVKIAAELRKNNEINLAKKLLDSIKNEKKYISNAAVDVTMAAALRKEKSLDEAVVLYEKVLEKEPNNNVAQIGLASVYKDLNRIDDAFVILDDFPQSEYSNPYFLNTIYSLALKTENYKQAEFAYKILSKYYAMFEPLKFLNQLIANYRAINYEEGLERMNNAKRILEKNL